MKVISRVGLLLVVASLCCWAQQNSRSSADQTSSKQSQVTLRGCLTGSNGDYTLATDNGNLYQLQGDEVFKDYSGKYVKLSGLEGAPANNPPRNPNAVKSALATAPPVIDVHSIQTVRSICQ